MSTINFDIARLDALETFGWEKRGKGNPVYTRDFVGSTYEVGLAWYQPYGIRHDDDPVGIKAVYFKRTESGRVKNYDEFPTLEQLADKLVSRGLLLDKQSLLGYDPNSFYAKRK